MAYHPVNLALRFLLEVVALFSFGLWAAVVHYTVSYERITWLLGR
jgi:hypothetical protein